MSSTRKVRIKKLNPRQALPILLEGQIDRNEYEALTTDLQHTRGVEQNEADVSLPSSDDLPALPLAVADLISPPVAPSRT